MNKSTLPKCQGHNNFIVVSIEIFLFKYCDILLMKIKRIAFHSRIRDDYIIIINDNTVYDTSMAYLY